MENCTLETYLGVLVLVAIILGKFILLYLALTKRIDSIGKDVNALAGHLGNPKTRGMWGERIAEDVIKSVGLVEGVHYFVQKTNEEGKRPDFTFKLLPTEIVCNMDSKFPLTNYIEYVKTGNKDNLDKFLKDVRARVREASRKSYIDPQAGTLNFAIVFIPNEQIFNFIVEHDVEFMDYCLGLKIVACSPWSLYGMLSMLYTNAEAFNMSKEAHKIVAEIKQCSKEWESLKASLADTHKQLENALSSSEHTSGTRSRQLERALNKLCR